MRSFKELEFGYWSIITNTKWYYVNSAGTLINSADGKWTEDNKIFQFDRDPNFKLDLNHVFVK